MSYIFLQILLSLIVNPLFEVVEVENVGVVDVSVVEPLYKKGKVVCHFFPVENAVHHVATEQSQLYLVSGMCMDLLVLVDGFENVRGGRSVCEFQLLE